MKTDKKKEPFDPSVFNDPIAMETKWTPARTGGLSFHAYRLVETGENRLEIHPTIEYILFISAFIMAGVGLIAYSTITQYFAGLSNLDIRKISPMFLGLVLMAIGGILFLFATVPAVFDKQAGLFWKQRKKPERSSAKSSSKKVAPLENIHALQIIVEFCPGKSSYYSYELNLVLKNAERINVADHGNLKKLIEDARILAEFLGVPIWNAAGG